MIGVRRAKERSIEYITLYILYIYIIYIYYIYILLKIIKKIVREKFFKIWQ